MPSGNNPSHDHQAALHGLDTTTPSKQASTENQTPAAHTPWHDTRMRAAAPGVNMPPLLAGILPISSQLSQDPADTSCCYGGPCSRLQARRDEILSAHGFSLLPPVVTMEMPERLTDRLLTDACRPGLMGSPKNPSAQQQQH
jgi:hypothetical protein